jgi:hypothetical protein
MEPVLSTTATTVVNKRLVKIIGEVYDEPVKKTETAMLYTVIKIQDELGNTVHPDFSFAAMLDQEHLDKTVNYIKDEMDKNPEQFFPQLKKEA